MKLVLAIMQPIKNLAEREAFISANNIKVYKNLRTNGKMKKGVFVLGFFLASFVASLDLISAQFSFGSMLNLVEPSTMILGIVFIVSFALINLALSRVFKDNPAIAGIVSFALSLGIIYSINYYGFDYAGFFGNIFFFVPSDVLYTFVPLILLIAVIALGAKFGFGMVLTAAGAMLVGISFTDLVYEKTVAAMIGGLIAFIGLWMWLRKKKSGLSGSSGYSGSSSDDYRSSLPNPKDVYKRELEERRNAEQVRQAQIKARAQNIAEIRKREEKRHPGRLKMKRYNEILAEIKSMRPSDMKKGTPGYDRYIRLYREAEQLRKELSI
jgi:hypothetical protein